MIRRAWSVLESGGPMAVLQAIGRRIVPPRLKCFSAAAPLMSGKRGLEIGGPSWLFARRGQFPAYGVAGSLDNCNFSSTTIWEGAIQSGPTFTYDPRHEPGTQYILEATDLSAIAAERYDFVLSSHMLEHCANPLRALREWMRIITAGGAIVLVIPHKEGTFDHRRPVTTLAHLIEDERNNTTECDMTHLPEILAFHDVTLDPSVEDFEALKARGERGFENRALHHHVFDTSLVVAMVDRVGLQIVTVEPVMPCHIFLVARKPGMLQPAENTVFLAAHAEYRRRSPFLLDSV